jgi:POT family proton-dependent oligopeptide transporter
MPAAAAPQEKTFLGHPIGLFVLFLTEMWERFSYYGMRTLLVLYMTDHLILKIRSGETQVVGFSTLQKILEGMYGPLDVQPLSSQIYGTYTSLVYLTPVFGGLIADRLLGARKTVVIGGILMAIGHFLMAVESLFLPALFFLVLGNGCFKPNISTQVGSLYKEGDDRRDRAFSIFYMGVNLGAFLSPFICGTLGQKVGWHYGFGAAGVGMIIGLLVYLAGQRYLPVDKATLRLEKMHEAEEAHKPVAPEKMTAAEWKAVAALMVLCLLNVVFWGVYEQQGNTIQIFADKQTDWTVFGWEMPSSWFQSVNPFFIFLLIPLLNVFWKWQSRRKKEPGSVAKMAIGCFLLGGSFLVLVYATKGLLDTQKISFLWLIGCTFIYTLGEIYLSPIGLSLVTKVAPVRLVGMMMGLWFLSSFLGNYLSGYLGMFYSSMTKDGFFMMLALLGMITGVAMFVLKRPVEKAIGRPV